MVQQRVSSRKKGGQPSTAPQRHKSVTGESTCGWCEKVIAEGDTWSGDVEVAVWLCAPIRKGARVLCRRCSERLPVMVEPAIRKLNRFKPELRLQMYAEEPLSILQPLSQVLPNLRICSDFYYQCKMARLEPDAGLRICDLLLRFEQNHPVEWECSGWKNDFIAELELGLTGDGSAEEREITAKRWLTQYWTNQAKRNRQTAIDDSEPRRRALYAIAGIQAVTGRPQKSAACNVVLTPAGIGLRSGWERALTSTGVQDRESYNSYVPFVRWLSKNWTQLTRKRGDLYRVAAETFRLERPGAKIADEVLMNITAAYDRCYSDGSPPPPSKVLLEFFAECHGVSSRLVAGIRAERNKKRTERRKPKKKASARSKKLNT